MDENKSFNENLELNENEAVIHLESVNADVITTNSIENIDGISVPSDNDIVQCNDDDIIPEIPSDLLDKIRLENKEASDGYRFDVQFFDSEAQEDYFWQARTGLNKDSLCGAIETIIFMSDRPVPITKIKGLIDDEIPLRVIHEVLSRLQEEYEKGHHGIRLLEVAEGYQFRTKATYSKYVQDLFKVNSLVLSPTALEVLAIIAYKQPVSKNEIEKIRGVDSSHVVRALMDRRLVKMVGRSEDLGRPVVYGTTQEFLEVFNLPDIGALPPEDELEDMACNQVGTISDIKNIVHTGDKKRFYFEETDELDQLSADIRSIDADTTFTKSLKLEDRRRTNSDGHVSKSAFEILEDHINSKKVKEQNIEAMASQLLLENCDYKVISDLSDGPFNEPLKGSDSFDVVENSEDERSLELASDDDELIDSESFELIKESIKSGNENKSCLDMDSFNVNESIEVEEFFDDMDESLDEDESSPILRKSFNESEQSNDIEVSLANFSSEIDDDEDWEDVESEDTDLEEDDEEEDFVDDLDMSPPDLPIEELRSSDDYLFSSDSPDIKSDSRDPLTAALDDAFAILMKESSSERLTDDNSDELKINDGEITNKTNNIDKITNNLVSKGEELDLDLSFMKDKPEQ